MIDLEQPVRSGVLMESRDDGVIDRFHTDGSITREQDVTALLERNRAERNEADRMIGFRRAPTFRKVASIPVAVFDLAHKQGIELFHDPDAMRKFLNNPENRFFRTTNERV